MSRTDQPDLFGEAPNQGEMFASGPPAERQPIWSEIWGWIEPPPAGGHTPETIRARMLKLLGEARAAETLPWTPRVLRSHTAMFPYMAEWLKGGEGEQLLLDFKAEMDRLEAPTDQVAPNWRKMWGLAA
jgi:hypothetical protein